MAGPRTVHVTAPQIHHTTAAMKGGKRSAHFLVMSFAREVRRKRVSRGLESWSNFAVDLCRHLRAIRGPPAATVYEASASGRGDSSRSWGIHTVTQVP